MQGRLVVKFRPHETISRGLLLEYTHSQRAEHVMWARDVKEERQFHQRSYLHGTIE